MKFEKDTEGVLLLCSKKGLKKYYLEREFNYDFPEGILPLINSGVITAIITESGEDVTGEIRIMEEINDKVDYNLSLESKLFIEEEDELFILSHGEFTQICSNNKGDIETFEFWNEKVSISNLKSGWCIVSVHTKISEEMPYIDIIFQLTSSDVEPTNGEMTEVTAV